MVNKSEISFIFWQIPAKIFLVHVSVIKAEASFHDRDLFVSSHFPFGPHIDLCLLRDICPSEQKSGREMSLIYWPLALTHRAKNVERLSLSEAWRLSHKWKEEI